MHETTKLALKVMRASKKLSLDRATLEQILADLRQTNDDEVWAALQPPTKPRKKPSDPLADAVKHALKNFKAPLAIKAQRLSAHLLPDREGAPKTMAAALKILRQYFSDDEIKRGAEEFMRKLREEGGMGVTL